MKEKFGQVKEFIGKLSKKTKALIVVGIAALLIGAVAIAFVLNNRPYQVLFSGLGQEEAQQIVEKLQADAVPFKYQGDSTILVEESVLDVTKAKLVQEGYPKSGFTYDTYKDNASMMATDSDKNTYKLYELQDRIGSTIRLFDGVKDAKVTIALGEESRYALNDENKEKSSATAVVTMKDGGSPTEEQALGIQRLVAKSIPKMELADVAVFDGNGNEISTSEEKQMNSSDAEEIAQIVEKQVAQNVMKVLGPIYGKDNVKVSARAKINMENLIRESTTYNTPEKIDEQDKTGIISHEELLNENSVGGTGAGGVAGTETNADTPEYNTNGAGGGSQAESESIVRDYLVDQIKEQGKIDPGALDDLTVSVAINGNNFGSLREAQLRSLIGNASGIAADDQAAKITVASAPFYQEPDDKDVEEVAAGIAMSPLQIGLLVGGIVLVLLLLLLFLLMQRRKKRKAKELAEAEALAAAVAAEEDGILPEALQALAEGEEASEEDAERASDLTKEMMEMQNDRGMELKKSIREFADKNPEISAQLLKNWLNGGKDGE